jgi:AraC-like DNA-binding protein
VEHVHDLVMLMLGATSTAKESGVRAARLQVIKADIAANVGRRDLSIGGVAARLGVSTRYVSMLFKDEGTTFSEFVLDARLRRAQRLLNNPRKINQPINAIALACGFGVCLISTSPFAGAMAPRRPKCARRHDDRVTIDRASRSDF